MRMKPSAELPLFRLKGARRGIRNGTHVHNVLYEGAYNNGNINQTTIAWGCMSAVKQSTALLSPCLIISKARNTPGMEPAGRTLQESAWLVLCARITLYAGQRVLQKECIPQPLCNPDQ